jgi:hypothetical protein
MNRSPASRALFAVALLAAWLAPAPALAAPYQLVAIYSKDSARKEVCIDDLMTHQDDNIVIPDAFTDDGAYHLTSIEERLDVKGIDDSYLQPMWRFSVYEATDKENFHDADGVTLDAKHSAASWTLTELLASHPTSDAVTTVRFKTQGSFTPEFLCGLETIYRGQHGKELDTKETGKKIDAALGDVYADTQDARPKKLIMEGTRVVLFSFCDAFLAVAHGADSVDWGKAMKYPYFQMGGAASTDALREAHHRALVELLFGDKFNANGLTLAQVAQPGARTNVVIEGSQSFSIIDLSALMIRERDNQKSLANESIGKIVDKNSTLEADFSSLLDQCSFAVSPPYSLLLVTTDEKKNPILIKTPVNVSTPCRPVLDVKWSDYLGKEIRIQLVYQLPGQGGRVLVSESPPFTVKELGLITTFPVVSEVITLATSANPKSLASTSSIPISWAMRLNNYSAGFTAVTFPWKLSFNTRDAPELAKNFAIYPHVSIIIPADGTKATYAVGGGISLAQFFNFAYGLYPQDGSRYLLIGLSIQDIVKVLN